jgi:hypothetical protein
MLPNHTALISIHSPHLLHTPRATMASCKTFMATFKMQGTPSRACKVRICPQTMSRTSPLTPGDNSVQYQSCPSRLKSRILINPPVFLYTWKHSKMCKGRCFPASVLALIDFVDWRTYRILSWTMHPHLATALNTADGCTLLLVQVASLCSGMRHVPYGCFEGCPIVGVGSTLKRGTVCQHCKGLHWSLRG